MSSLLQRRTDDRKARLRRFEEAAKRLEERSRPPEPLVIVEAAPEPEPVEEAILPAIVLNEVTAIKRIVAKKFDLKEFEITGSSRLPRFVIPRQVGIYLCKKLTDRSLNYIGGKFGGRDHATVLHSVRKIEERMAKDPELRAIVEELEAQIIEERAE